MLEKKADDKSIFGCFNLRLNLGFLEIILRLKTEIINSQGLLTYRRHTSVLRSPTSLVVATLFDIQSVHLGSIGACSNTEGLKPNWCEQEHASIVSAIPIRTNYFHKFDMYIDMYKAPGGTTRGCRSPAFYAVLLPAAPFVPECHKYMLTTNMFAVF